MAEKRVGREESSWGSGVGTMRAMDMVSIGTASGDPARNRGNHRRHRRRSGQPTVAWHRCLGNRYHRRPTGRGTVRAGSDALAGRRHRRRAGGGVGAPLLDTLTPVARRGPDRQHRQATAACTLPTFLKRDGAPPLYYVLLHGWMGVFGDSDLAVRSLSGVIGVVTVPLVWLAGRRFGGRTGRLGGDAVGGYVAVRRSLRHRDKDVRAGRAVDRARAAGHAAGLDPAPNPATCWPWPSSPASFSTATTGRSTF